MPIIFQKVLGHGGRVPKPPNVVWSTVIYRISKFLWIVLAVICIDSLQLWLRILLSQRKNKLLCYSYFNVIMFPANIRNFTPAMLELYILRSSFNAVLILSSIKEIANAVNSGIEASLLFNFWTFGKVLHLSFYPLFI